MAQQIWESFEFLHFTVFLYMRPTTVSQLLMTVLIYLSTPAQLKFPYFGIIRRSILPLCLVPLVLDLFSFTSDVRVMQAMSILPHALMLFIGFSQLLVWKEQFDRRVIEINDIGLVQFMQSAWTQIKVPVIL